VCRKQGWSSYYCATADGGGGWGRVLSTKRGPACLLGLQAQAGRQVRREEAVCTAGAASEMHVMLTGAAGEKSCSSTLTI
jgi:hypothetical protein